jgi:hypothetical protein
MSCIAGLNDGHIFLGLSYDVLGKESFLFKFEYLNDGYYLTKSSKDLSEYLGSKLLGINSCNIQDLEKRISPFIPQENETSTRYYLSSKIVEPNILEFVDIKKGKSIELQLEQQNKEFSVKAYPQDCEIEMIPIERWIPNTAETLEEKDSYWFKELDDLKAFYFQYNECHEREDLPISEVINNFKKSDFKVFIIDLRNNKGGDSNVLKPLVIFFKKSPGKYSKIILTGADTYSSAIINLLELSNIPNTISVGEIPHGNPTHYGEVESFILPNSKLKVFTSSKIFRFKGYKLGEAFKPTHIINTRIDDLLGGKDTQIEYLSKIL